MSIDFDSTRWDTIKQRSNLLWQGKLDGPLIQMRVGGHNPGRPEPTLPNQAFTAFYDSDITAQQIVDRWDYNLSCLEYLGDGFPAVWPNFGPGVLSAMIGSKLECAEDTVWFYPEEQKPLSELKLSLSEDNKWVKRISDIMRTAVDYWQGNVQVGMTDLGGNIDVLVSFRPGEQLLFDLYDHPQDVLNQIWVSHDLWWEAYNIFNKILQPENPGYSVWANVFSEDPYYMLQCDFCYMIGPDMFDKFIKPELTACCKKLTNSFYHLDGPGELVHLDSLLQIEELNGIQWIPGAGANTIEHWPEVYQKIRDAGKLIQIFSGQSKLGYRVLDVIADQLGSADGIIMVANAKHDELDDVHDFLRQYGC